MREKKRNRIWILLAAVWLILPLVARIPISASDQQHEYDKPSELPDTADAIWQEIAKQMELLSTTIASGELAKVHQVAFAVRDLAKGLPERSEDLPEAKQKLLRGYVQRIEEHATNLDTYGDAGNQSKTEAEFSQLEKRLDYMRKLYHAVE